MIQRRMDKDDKEGTDTLKSAKNLVLAMVAALVIMWVIAPMMFEVNVDPTATNTDCTDTDPDSICMKIKNATDDAGLIFKSALDVVRYALIVGAVGSVAWLRVRVAPHATA